jgi:hypothetical protein
MIANQPRYSKEEFARRGDEMYERVVRPQLSESDMGKFVALDIETGKYEMDDDLMVACDRLDARQPDGQVWLVRVGSRAVHRFGGHSLRREG